MNHFPRWLTATAISMLLMGCVVADAAAGVILSGTRVIYPASEREVTLRMQNNGDMPRLVQSWLDDGDSSQTAETSRAPFLLTPPMTRIEPNKGQALRLVYTGEPLPADRESVFWLNVLDVPPRPKADEASNYMQVALRTRIKVFFRPKGLAGDPLGAVDQLQWRLVHDGKGYAVECGNPSAYHVSFAQIWIKGRSPGAGVGGGGMVAPGTTQRFPVDGDGDKVVFKVINDYGGMFEREAVLSR